MAFPYLPVMLASCNKARVPVALLLALSLLIVLGWPITAIAQSQPQDSASALLEPAGELSFEIDTTSAQSHVHNSEFDGPPFLEAAPLLFLGVIIILIALGVGIVLAAISLVGILAIIGIGLISTSALVAIHHRSLKKGFQTFLVATFTVLGSLFGLVALWLHNLWADWGPHSAALIVGAMLGCLIGLGAGVATKKLLHAITASRVAQQKD